MSSSSPVTRPKTRYAGNTVKNNKAKKKGQISVKEVIPTPVDVSDSLSDFNSVNSTEFLETLNLKSKDKTESNGDHFTGQTFLSEDGTCSSSLYSCAQKAMEKDSTIEALLESPVMPSLDSKSQNTKENQESLGKTLAFSLQLIAAGDTSIMPQSPSIPEGVSDMSPKESLYKQSKDEMPNDSEEDSIELKEETMHHRSRCRTRSSLSNIDNQAISDSNKDDSTVSTTSQDLVVNDSMNLSVVENQHQELQTGEEPQPTTVKKRGRRKKENSTCSMQKGNTYLCSQCGKAFNKRQTLRQHFITHTDRFACTFCNVRCKSKGDLKSHTQTHTKEKPYRCEVCNTFYTRESILKKHKLTQLHKNACFQLGNQIHLALKGDMNAYESKRLEMGTFSCYQCSKKFGLKQDLRQHIKVHNYKFSCPQCHKRCKTALMLKVHKKCHLKSTSVSCKFCSLGFSNLRLLREHIKVAHSFLIWQRKFPGNLWKALLGRKVDCFDDLKVEFFHSGNKTGKLVCSVCSRNFKSKKAFEKHVEKHKVNQSPVSAAEKSLADQSSSRKIHQFQCSECNKSFAYCDEFCKHHTEYHNGKPMTCHICYSQFESSAKFKSHVQNHGPTMLFSGASLEESKIAYVSKRYKHYSRNHFGYESKSVEEKHDKKIMRYGKSQEESDDESFLESSEFIHLLSGVLTDCHDKDEEGSCDEDEDLYIGLKMLMHDNDLPLCINNEKVSNDKQSDRVFKKHEMDMKIFSVEDDESNFYKCTPCDLIFITCSQLQDHMRSHICLYCDVFCRSKEELAVHYHRQEKQCMKIEIEKNDLLDEVSETRSDDIAFNSDDDMNEVFLDELEGILDNESKSTPPTDFLSTFSHDEIIRTNKKIFERYSCIDVPTNIYACIICKRKYARPTTLTRHFKTHVCQYCNTFFVDKSDLTDHKYKHRKKAAMIKAEISGDSSAKILHSPLVSKANRELFKKFTMVDGSRNINKCCLCDKLFVRKTVLTRHMKTHVCSYCDKFYEDKYELARHVSLHKLESSITDDDTVQQQYPVYDEEKPFVASSAFSNQLESNEKIVDIEPSYSSSLPQFTATLSTPNTNSHETVTYIQIPVSEECADPNNVAFNTGVVTDTPTYQIISDSMVPNQGSYIVAPQNCHEDDSNKLLTLTQDHMVTANQCQVATTDLFENDVCDKTFFKGNHLKSHMSTHSGPSQFACRYCGKTFVRSGPLRKHEKTHEVKRCEHCDLSFTCQYELDHHMQIHESYPFYK